MTIQIELWHLITLFLGFFGTIGAFCKFIVMMIDKRISKLEEHRNSDYQEFLKFKSEMPEKYVMRTDYARDQTVLMAKLDTIYKRLMENGD